MTDSTSAGTAGAKPFVGLAPFTEADARYFFGRDADRDIIISNLIAARLTVIYGPSGCGKSSLLNAGVLHEVNQVRAPRQIAARGAPEFVAVTFRDWRDNPRLGLLARLGEKVESVLGRSFEQPSAGLPLADSLSEWADRLGGTGSLLIVLDQFEEYFLYHGRKVVEEKFAHDLAKALRHPGLRANFLISIREDALAQLDAFEGHIPNLLSNTLRLDRLDRKRGRLTIEGPIHKYNEAHLRGGRPIRIGPGLVDAVLETVEAGAITLESAGRGRIEEREEREDNEHPIETAYLQLVMARLWEEEAKASSPDLRPETFHRLGGAQGIVRNHLDTVLGRLGRDHPAPRQGLDRLFALTLTSDQRIAEEMLTYLVTSSGTKIALDPNYLADRTGQSTDRVAAVLDRLASSDRRVLRKIEHPAQKSASYEVFHDVLARVIVDDYVPRVRLQRERKGRFLFAAGFATALLLVALATWQWWEASRQTQRAEENAKLAARNAETSKAAQAAAEAQAEIAREATLKARAATLEAKKQARLRTSIKMAALSSSERNKRLDRSLLLAVEALRTEKTTETRESLLKALQSRPGLASFLHATLGPVLSVTFSADGKTIAAACDGGVGVGVGVVLWDLASRKQLADKPLPVPEGNVFGVAFSRDCRTLATGYGRGDGGGVVLWDSATSIRSAAEPFPVPEGHVWRLAFSPDGKTLAAGYLGTGGGGVILWDLASRKRLADPLLVREGRVLDVAFSPDGKTLAAGYDEGRGGGVILWDAAGRGRLADPLSVREGRVLDVAFNPDSRTLAAGYDDGHGGGVILWDAARRERLAAEPLLVPEGSVLSIAFNPDGKTLAAGYYVGSGGGVVLWDTASRKRLAKEPLPVGEGRVINVAFSPDGKAIAAGYGHGFSFGGVALWDLTDHKRLAEDTVQLREGATQAVAFSLDGKTLAVGYRTVSAEGGVVFWDLVNRKRLTEDALPVREGAVTAVAFGPDGRTLAAGYLRGRGGGLVLWDLAGRKRLSEEPLPLREGSVLGLAFCPDGKTLAVAYSSDSGGGGGVVLWDLSAHGRLAEEPLPLREGRLLSIAFSMDGQTLAAGYNGDVGGDVGGGVVLWDLKNRKRLAEDPLPLREGSATDVGISLDGKTLAAVYYDDSGGGVVLWDLAGRRRLAEAPLPVREGRVLGVCFSPDCKTLAAGYEARNAGGGVVLWDLANRNRLAADPLPVQGHPICLAFSPDSNTLAAGYDGVGGTGEVRLWDVDLESWVRKAGRVANRNFTWEEWRQYLPDEPFHRTFRELPWPSDLPPTERTQAEKRENELPSHQEVSTS
jgi:WD40 repeat protein